MGMLPAQQLFKEKPASKVKAIQTVARRSSLSIASFGAGYMGSLNRLGTFLLCSSIALIKREECPDIK